jgi:hypothetical protein
MYVGNAPLKVDGFSNKKSIYTEGSVFMSRSKYTSVYNLIKSSRWNTASWTEKIRPCKLTIKNVQL